MLKNESFEVYGLHLPRIKEVLPTELPAITANVRTMDNLFLLEDGSYAIVDYESKYKEDNWYKYADYISRTHERLRRQGIDHPQIILIVIYTCGVRKGSVPESFDCGALRITPIVAYLTEFDGEGNYHKLKKEIETEGNLDGRGIMELSVLPLSCKRSEQEEMLEKCFHLAISQSNDEKVAWALSLLAVFSDKIISEALADQIKRRIQMTCVGQLVINEIEEKYADQLKEKDTKLKEKDTKLMEKDTKLKEKDTKLEKQASLIDLLISYIADKDSISKSDVLSSIKATS